MKDKNILVLDVGTTGVKAFVFDSGFRVASRSYRRLRTYRHRGGRVEQSPAEMVREAISAIREAVEASGIRADGFSAMGVTNQRETMILWDGRNGEPLHRAVVWEDQRCKGVCERLDRSFGKEVRGLTGLPISAYFSAPEVRWILDHDESVASASVDGDLRFGTVDSWMLWNLAAGHPHLTDWTNASRTLLYDIKARDWSDRLLSLFDVPSSCLPLVRPSASFFGTLSEDVLGFPLPIMSVCGDQQASAYAAMMRSGRRTSGATKATFGTGAFVSQVVGDRFVLREGLFTTLVPGFRSEPSYCLEAKIDRCGERVAAAIGHPVKLNATLTDLARRTDRIVKKLPLRPKAIVIDGGVTRDGLLAKILGEVTGIEVLVQPTFDGTALGAAMLAARAGQDLS